MTKTIRALGLFSGGLDSMLAAAVLRAQGIDVTLICWVTPFFGAARARESAAHLGLPLREADLTDKFLPLIYDPPHGWGRGHNPCIDCHALMLREAGALMAPEGFDFLFTGEVLGQRPMSQNRGSLNLIARESGFADLLLRPLSAKSLQATRTGGTGLGGPGTAVEPQRPGAQTPDGPGPGIRHHPVSRPGGGVSLNRSGVRGPDQGVAASRPGGLPDGPGTARLWPALPPARRGQVGGGPDPAG